MSISFIPDKASENGTYLCTWEQQKKVAHKENLPGANIPERQRNALTAELLFNHEENYHLFSRDYRSGMYFLLDDGWDVPFNTNTENGTEAFGSLQVDSEKFAEFGATPSERLCKVSQRIKDMGYAGLGLWVSPQRCFDSEPFDMEEHRKYWIERAKESSIAGVKYWKVDWGKCSATEGYREMMTDCIKKYSPGTLIEHASEMAPFSCYTDEKIIQSIKSMRERFYHSDFLRTYDVKPPFADLETLARVNMLFEDIDFSKMQEGAVGFINVESQPLVAAGLGFNLGVMEKDNDVLSCLRWQRVSPPFSATAGSYNASDETVTDSLCFDYDPAWWLKGFIGKTYSITLPAAISRCTKLPKVTADGLSPIIIASKNPDNCAFSVAALPRIKDPNSKVIATADVTVYPETHKAPIGIFGHYNSLTVEFGYLLPENITVFAQCMLSDSAVDISDRITKNRNSITLDGKLLRMIGHNPNDPTTYHTPAVMIVIK